MLTSWADKKHHKQELSVLKNANVVLSIGQSMSDELLDLYKKSGGKDLNKFKVIANGFDNDDLKTGTIIKDLKFSIAHIGTLVKDRNPQVLWRVLNKIIKENVEFKNQLEIKLVGKIDIYVKEQIEEFGLTPYVNKIEYLPHNKVIEEQQKSKLLLLLVNNTKNAKGILTGKFFEYMSANAPVLAIGPIDGDLAEILNKTKTGLISNFTDEKTLEKNIVDYFNGKVIERNEAEVNKYSRRSLTNKLCDILKDL